MPLNAAVMAENFNRALVAAQFGVDRTDPVSLLALAKAAKENNPMWLVDVKMETFDCLQRQGFIEKSGLALTTKGKELSTALAQTLPTPFSESLKKHIRSFRTLMDGISIPALNKFWWRNLAWRFRNWWAETHPEPRPIIDMGELVPVKLWTAEDERRNGEMWVESKFSAFWLCPSGVDKGLEHLRTLEKLKKRHGKKCIDAAFAIGEFAKQVALLPAPQPKLPAPSASDTLTYDAVTNKTYLNGTEVCGPSGVGKTYAVAVGDAFISVHGDRVEAARTAIELADEQATKAVKALNRRKPKQFVIIDDFCKTFNEFEDERGIKALKELAGITGRTVAQEKRLARNDNKPKAPRPSKK